MKKICVVICLISILFNLAGCIGNRRRFSENEIESRANEFAKTVISAISEYDEEKFDNLFTDEALSSPDYEKGKAYILEIFEGEIISFQQSSYSYGGNHSKYGKSYTPKIAYDIKTDKNDYSLYMHFYVDGYNTDTGKHYKNKIMRLRLDIKSELPENEFYVNNGGMGDLEGIYYPEIELDY